ncbi:MAG: hypothetical protein ACI3Z8_06050 [Paludibacteraceae bacterium]
MKKIQLALMCAVVAVLFACKPNGVSVKDMDATKLDNTTAKCWGYTLIYSDGKTTDGYMWGTEQHVVKYLQIIIKSASSTIANEPQDITYWADGTKDEQSCMDKNM